MLSSQNGAFPLTRVFYEADEYLMATANVCTALHIWMWALQCKYLVALHCIYLDGGSAMHIFGCIDCIYLVRDAVQRLFGGSAMYIFGCKRCAVHPCFCFKTASGEYLVCGEIE